MNVEIRPYPKGWEWDLFSKVKHMINWRSGKARWVASRYRRRARQMQKVDTRKRLEELL